MRNLCLITLLLALVALPHYAGTGRLVHHVDVAFQGADGGRIHGFDCLDGPEECGGRVTEDQRQGGQPLVITHSVKPFDQVTITLRTGEIP